MAAKHPPTISLSPSLEQSSSSSLIGFLKAGSSEEKIIYYKMAIGAFAHAVPSSPLLFLRAFQLFFCQSVSSSSSLPTSYVMARRVFLQFSSVQFSSAVLQSVSQKKLSSCEVKKKKVDSSLSSSFQGVGHEYLMR